MQPEIANANLKWFPIASGRPSEILAQFPSKYKISLQMCWSTNNTGGLIPSVPICGLSRGIWVSLWNQDTSLSSRTYLK